MQARSSLRGVVMVLAAALLWGTTGTAQSLVPTQLSPSWVGSLRLAVAALFFLPWLLPRGRRNVASPAPAALPWHGILVAAACMCAYNLAFFAGVRSAGVAIGTAVALGSGPVWAGALQAVVSRRLPDPGWWLGTGVAVAGVVVMVTAGGVSAMPSPLGIALCLLAGVSYAVYALVNQRMVAKAAAGRLTAAVFIGAAALAVPITALTTGLPALSLREAAVVLWLGVMSTGVAYLLFSHALRHVSVATAVALALAEPVVAFLLAILVVGERPGPVAVAGLAAVLAGLGIVVRHEVAAPARPARLI
jgi:drug/metabolite transporter, DME family